MPAHHVTWGLALSLTVLTLPAAAQEAERTTDVRRALAGALEAAGSSVTRGYGYGSSSTAGAATGVKLFQWHEEAKYLVLQPLASGERVGALVAFDGETNETNLVTKQDLLATISALAGVEYRAPVATPAGAVTSASFGDVPIREEESILDRAKTQMTGNDSIAAIRVRDDTTYHTEPAAVTVSYVMVGASPKHYVLVSELLGSVKSGKPYVDVYLRGYEAIGGGFSDDGAPRSELIKSKPWRGIEDVPEPKEFADNAYKAAKAGGDKKAAPGAKLTPTQEGAALDAALVGINRERGGMSPMADTSSLVLVGVTETEGDLRHALVVAPAPENSPGNVGLYVARLIVQGSKDDDVVLERVRVAKQADLDRTVERLAASAPAAVEESRPKDEDTQTPVVDIPVGTDESAELAMRKVALQLFDSNPGVRALIQRVGSLGGKTGVSHALTAGRDATSPYAGSYYFLVTRTTSKLDKSKSGLVENAFTTYGRIYQFSFTGGAPKELDMKGFPKLLELKNVD